MCVRAHVCVRSCVCMCERERESQVEGHLACVWVHMGLSVFLLCVHICMNLSVGGYYTVCVSSHSSVSECVCLCVHVPKCHPTMCMCVWVRVCVCVCVCVGCGQRRSMVCKVDSLLACLLWQLLKEAH